MSEMNEFEEENIRMDSIDDESDYEAQMQLQQQLTHSHNYESRIRKYSKLWQIQNRYEMEQGTNNATNTNEDRKPSDFEIDLREIHFKNIGEVAAAALLNKRLQRGSITSADIPIRFRRNAAVLSDGKMVVMYHQQLKTENNNKRPDSAKRNSVFSAPEPDPSTDTIEP